MGITTSSSSDFWSVLYISPQALLQVACLRNFYLSLRYIWLYLNNHFNVSASGINIRVTFMTHMLYTVYISVCATNIYLKSVYRSAFLLTVSFLSAKCECGNFKWHILSRKQGSVQLNKSYFFTSCLLIIKSFDCSCTSYKNQTHLAIQRR